MARIEIELNPVTHITTDAIGKPGERVFYIQARKDGEVVTLLVEKVQIQTLAVGVEQFLAELAAQHPQLPPASVEYREADMHLVLPVDPVFRIGELGLGYDEATDRMLLSAQEVSGENSNENEIGIARFWATRSQMRAMAQWGMELANRGRQICPQCGEPMDPQGHFCPKKNGHKH